MLAIRAGRLFDGVDAVAVERPLVLIENGRIAAVQSGAEPPAEAEVVDLGAATLLPGLIDSHVHLVFDASTDPVGHLDGAGDAEVLTAMRARARIALAAGITTVRDLGDRGYLAVELRDELAADPTAGPLILAAGPPITTGRGHCWYLGGEAIGGVDGVRAAVREHAERGVDVIKLMATGGELTAGTASYVPQFAVAELRAAVDEAEAVVDAAADLLPNRRSLHAHADHLYCSVPAPPRQHLHAHRLFVWFTAAHLRDSRGGRRSAA